jgi:isoleucyl-tRNA synthetase
VLPGDNGVVLLDVGLTAELEEEGYARDVVRLIQQGRRVLGLRVTDRITGAVAAPADVAAAVGTHRDWIAEQVLAVELSVSHPVPVPPPADGIEATLPDGRTVWLWIVPVTPPSGG